MIAHNIKITNARVPLFGEPDWSVFNVSCGDCGIERGPMDLEQLSDWLREHVAQCEFPGTVMSKDGAETVDLRYRQRP